MKFGYSCVTCHSRYTDRTDVIILQADVGHDTAMLTVCPKCWNDENQIRGLIDKLNVRIDQSEEFKKLLYKKLAQKTGDRELFE